MDKASGRLIVTSLEVFTADVNAALLAVVVRPGEPTFARSCLVAARLETPSWLILNPTAPWQTIARRLAERTAVMLPAEGHRYVTPDGALIVRGIVRDLSATGFRFDCTTHVGLGELLVLNIQAPDGEIIRLGGRTQRAVRPSPASQDMWVIGCQFWGVSLSDQERIAHLIDRRPG